MRREDRNSKILKRCCNKSINKDNLENKCCKVIRKENFQYKNLIIMFNIFQKGKDKLKMIKVFYKILWENLCTKKINVFKNKTIIKIKNKNIKYINIKVKNNRKSIKIKY